MADTTLTSIAGNQTAIAIRYVDNGDSSYSAKVVVSGAATPAQTSPQLTNASSQILAANSGRRGATIWNEGAAVAYVKLGVTASTTSYSIQIASGAYYEVPFGYTGEVDGITSSSTAQLRVTELTV